MTTDANRHERLTADLKEIAGRVAAEAGVELVDLELHGSSKNRTLRVFIDRAGPGGVGLEDCKRISDRMGEELDESDLIRNRYVLEVSSPGVDRPIRSADDVRRNTGRKIVVTTREPIDGKQRFRGVLVDGETGSLRLRGEGGAEIRIPISVIESARQDVGF